MKYIPLLFLLIHLNIFGQDVILQYQDESGSDLNSLFVFDKHDAYDPNVIKGFCRTVVQYNGEASIVHSDFDIDQIKDEDDDRYMILFTKNSHLIKNGEKFKERSFYFYIIDGYLVGYVVHDNYEPKSGDIITLPYTTSTRKWLSIEIFAKDFFEKNEALYKSYLDDWKPGN